MSHAPFFHETPHTADRQRRSRSNFRNCPAVRVDAISTLRATEVNVRL